MTQQAQQPLKGFRQPPKQTKAEVNKENASLSQTVLTQLGNLRVNMAREFQRLYTQLGTQGQELNQLSFWIGAAPLAADQALEKGDHLILDYAGVLLNEDGTVATVDVKDEKGETRKVPNYFDGGSGKFFMLTNLVGGTLIPGFEEQMVGLKAGEGKEIEVQFPEDYNVPMLKKAKARFTIYVHEARRSHKNSPVGDVIDEMDRLKREARAKAAADAKAAAEAKKAAEETENKGPGADSVPSGVEETPAT